tara:strand:+ start:189 stop:368 length:180 start_codon:yes stop_codon:yes gene_type:complete
MVLTLYLVVLHQLVEVQVEALVLLLEVVKMEALAVEDTTLLEPLVLLFLQHKVSTVEQV